MQAAIPVFYRPEQVADICSFSPSPKKPAPVVAAWEKLGNVVIETFSPVSAEDLCLTHAEHYIHGVLSGKIRNGFGNCSKPEAETMRYTVGSFCAAALHAFYNGGVAASPTSGFHHAGFSYGGGFCTFNGLTTAASLLIEAGADRVGILDCDQHYGDGTADILWRLPELSRKVVHYTQGRGTIPCREDVFLRDLPRMLRRKFKDCDVLLYQAGADPHKDDPLGGWLTTKGLKERDRIVFSTCKELGIPVAFNLAGGYQDPLSKVVGIHKNTMQACQEVYLGR